VTVKVCPAIASVPVRAAAVEFAATLYVRTPVPVPLAPALTTIHGTVLVLLHPQPV
jgi:hypothetical protein